MRESTKMLLHYASGIIVAVTGAIHLLASNIRALEWIKETPLYPLSQGIFLAAVLYHGLNGVRVILAELMPGTRTGKILSYSLAAIGAALFVFGVYALITIFGR